jgi:glycosyltransferase involved in cell wall biosynthesis
MKVALVSSMIPFIPGGAKNIVAWLAHALEDAGHEVEVIDLPFNERPERVVRQLAAFRMIDLTDQADLVVCFRPPSYLVRHPRKVLWFIHHIRPYYDLWESDQYRGFGDTLISRARRDVIRRADDRAFAEAERIFTNSRVMSERLRTFNGVDSEVLYPPVENPEGFVNTGYGDEIVAVARLEPQKRQHLLVEALGLTRTPVSLRLIGKGSNPDYARSMRARADELGVGDRLVVSDQFVEEDEKRALIGAALATAYIPVDEDSYGYASLESAHAAKAIITTTDSGGVLEFVQDGRNGYIREPDAAALAATMDQLWNDRDLAARLGEAAGDRLGELDISWKNVVERITS